MIKKYPLIIIICLLYILPVFSAPVPQDVDTQEIQTIQQEHKNTRKFFSDELTRQRNDFFKEMEDRAHYYETEAEDLVRTVFWKLALLWGAIVFIIFGLLNVLRLKLKEKEIRKLKNDIKNDILNELKIQQKPEFVEQKYTVTTKEQRDDFRQGFKNFISNPYKDKEKTENVKIGKRVTF